MGAWIETLRLSVDFAKSIVAPHVGAWIETHIILRSASARMSHPTWVRGLKLALFVVIMMML